MKRFLQHALPFVFFLLTLSFSFETFANGQPSIRRVVNGGGGNPDPCIPNNGYDYTIKFEVAIAASDFVFFFDNCDLYVGYESLTSDITYIPMPAVGFEPSVGNPDVYVQSFEVLLTGAEIEEMCTQEIYTFNMDLYCLVYDVFQSISYGLGTDFGAGLCCSERPDKRSLTFEDNEAFTLINKVELENSKEDNTNHFSDYYIYDIQGNPIDVLKNQSTNISAQQHISNLPIPSGIYFIRFWNGSEMETTKVFKL